MSSGLDSKACFAASIMVMVTLGGAGALAQPQNNRVCISTRDIVSSEPQRAGAAITFTMRDGSIWRNDLRGPCNDLTFNGFAWVLHNPDQTVCENEQSLRVIQSGQICQLGRFSQIRPPRRQ